MLEILKILIGIIIKRILKLHLTVILKIVFNLKNVFLKILGV